MNKLTGYVFFSSYKLPRVRENLIAVHNTACLLHGCIYSTPCMNWVRGSRRTSGSRSVWNTFTKSVSQFLFFRFNIYSWRYGTMFFCNDKESFQKCLDSDQCMNRLQRLISSRVGHATPLIIFSCKMEMQNLTTSKEANKTSLINSMMGWKKMHAPENTDGFKSAWIVKKFRKRSLTLHIPHNGFSLYTKWIFHFALLWQFINLSF